MKIASSNLLLQQNTQRQSTAARALDTSVSVNQNQFAGSADSATIRRAQLIEALSSINSNGLSVVTDANGNTKISQSTYAIADITRLALEQDIQIQAVSFVNPSRENVVNITVDRVMAFETSNNLQLSSFGSVTTEDGRNIDFLLELNYQRDMQVTQTSQFRGNRNLIDPLVINLTGGPAQLSDQYFEFDLNSDGMNEQLHQTASGTGFLVLDKNDNGIIDDGSEMFGPSTGLGFQELAAYDEDGNGWIDENDSIFSQLSFMDFTADGEQRIQGIADVGLGAIALESINMDYDLYDSQGNFQAQVARNGVALMENGSAVSIQEIYYPGQATGMGELENTSTIDINNTGDISRNASALTQFQVNDDIVSARNENTRVRVVPSVSSFNLPFNNLPANTSNTNQNQSNQAQSNQVQTSNTQSAPENINTTAEAQDKRAAIQAYFQQRIESDYGEQLATSAPANTQPSGRVQVDNLSQSVSWDYSQTYFQGETQGDKKLHELQLLVQSLKEIRERQIKLQEKLDIYHQVK